VAATGVVVDIQPDRPREVEDLAEAVLVDIQVTVAAAQPHSQEQHQMEVAAVAAVAATAGMVGGEVVVAVLEY